MTNENEKVEVIPTQNDAHELRLSSEVAQTFGRTALRKSALPNDDREERIAQQSEIAWRILDRPYQQKKYYSVSRIKAHRLGDRALKSTIT